MSNPSEAVSIIPFRVSVLRSVPVRIQASTWGKSKADTQGSSSAVPCFSHPWTLPYTSQPTWRSSPSFKVCCLPCMAICKVFTGGQSKDSGPCSRTVLWTLFKFVCSLFYYQMSRSRAFCCSVFVRRQYPLTCSCSVRPLSFHYVLFWSYIAKSQNSV